MVRLHIKRCDESQFIFDANFEEKVENLIRDICAIFNGRLKIQRLCAEIKDLSKHGIMLPSEMIGLTEEQIIELKLTDTWADKCIPSGGFTMNPDEIGRRNGRQPEKKMQEVLKKAISDARELVDKKHVVNNHPLTLKIIEEALNILRGAVMIVYPMQLPPHDPIRMEFTNTEDLSGMQSSNEVIEVSKAVLWFAGHQLLHGKTLKDYCGNNDKSKLLIKLTKSNEGPPGREMAMTDELRKSLMAEQFRRQEELKKLQQDDDDQYFNSSWADGSGLKKQVHGLEDVKFRIGM